MLQSDESAALSVEAHELELHIQKFGPEPGVAHLIVAISRQVARFGQVRQMQSGLSRTASAIGSAPSSGLT